MRVGVLGGDAPSAHGDIGYIPRLMEDSPADEAEDIESADIDGEWREG